MKIALRTVADAVARVALRAVDVLLTRFGYQRTRRILDLTSPGWHLGASVETRAARVVAVFRRASRGMAESEVNVTCLRRSLAGRWAGRWLGAPTDLEMGLDPTDATLKAHAWLSIGRVVLGEPPSVRAQYSIPLTSVSEHALGPHPS